MPPEIVVGPEGRVGAAAVVLRGAVGRGVGDADDAAEVGRAEPPLLVVVGTIQLPSLILQARNSLMLVLSKRLRVSLAKLRVQK